MVEGFCLVNQGTESVLKNHELNKEDIGVTDESISDWIRGLQDTFSSSSSCIEKTTLQTNVELGGGGYPFDFSVSQSTNPWDCRHNSLDSQFQIAKKKMES